MSIRRYTTPAYSFTVQGIDLTSADIYVTFKQQDFILTFDGDSVSTALTALGDTRIYVFMTQEDTAKFKGGKTAQVQVNWIVDNYRNATDIATIEITKNLLERVIDDE